MGFKDVAGLHLFGAVQAVATDLRDKIENGVTPKVTDKEGYAPGSEDQTTDLDGQADELYRTLLEPHAAMQSEDGAQDGSGERWCVDAVDGTRSLAAGMHGYVGTMAVALDDQEACAAYAASVMTGEMVGFDCARHDGRVASYTLDIRGELVGEPINLAEGLYDRLPERMPVQVRRSSSGRIQYSAAMEKLLRPGVAFSNEQLVKGSFAVGMFPLWRGEVAAQVIPASYYLTPWDNNPVFAICKELGIEALVFNDHGQLVPFDMRFIEEKRPGTELLLVHGAFVRDTQAVARAVCRAD